MYYWPPGRTRALADFYRPLVPAGGLAFDIGAHVGNRSRAWRRLGARVVAVEPQPDCHRFLAWLFARDDGVQLVDAAIDRAPGAIELHLSEATPTVTTASPEFIADTSAIPSFAAVRWDRVVRVPALTLDELIARFGRPDFVKIDIEGHEAAALAGLSAPVPALSFEFLAAAVPRAKACLDRIEALGRYRFNVSRGESLAFVCADWVDRADLDAWLDAVAGADFSGDIYARQVD